LVLDYCNTTQLLQPYITVIYINYGHNLINSALCRLWLTTVYAIGAKMNQQWPTC